MTTQANKWTNKYTNSLSTPIYPTEWVIRTIGGANYPNFKFDKSLYKGKKILDISCGDGRNLEFLIDLGFEVYASEVSEEITNILSFRFPKVNFSIGFNHKHVYKDNYFDFALSCGSFYYLEPNTDFKDNLNELHRILKPNSIFYTNIPTPKTYILKNSIKLQNGEHLIQNDPHNFRNGYRWQTANNSKNILSLFSPNFELIACSKIHDNYFGYLISNYIVVSKNIK